MLELPEAVAELQRIRRGELAVVTMTQLSYWPASGEIGELDFPLAGLMGAASAIGLGLALARPSQRVWVLDGDGSALMQLGNLAAIADAAPRNFVHVIFANRTYNVSGAQKVPGGSELDWPGLARSVGYRSVAVVRTLAELAPAMEATDEGPALVCLELCNTKVRIEPTAYSMDVGLHLPRLHRAMEGRR